MTEIMLIIKNAAGTDILTEPTPAKSALLWNMIQEAYHEERIESFKSIGLYGEADKHEEYRIACVARLRKLYALNPDQTDAAEVEYETYLDKGIFPIAV